MFRVPDHYPDLSLKLSSVLKDIGVTETTVLRRRRTFLLIESLYILNDSMNGRNQYIHIFGSKSEGTTTGGLKSDTDFLGVKNTVKVITNWSEWEVGLVNLLMLQDTSIAPGYCMLQFLERDAPLLLELRRLSRDALLQRIRENLAIYGGDKVILKNTVMEFTLKMGRVRDGPAAHSKEEGFSEQDIVLAFPFKSLPPFLSLWLRRQFQQGRISREMKEYIETSPCYVVPVGRHDSQYREAEWRISTSHAERCLMLNLNITQLQCYVMLKMIKNTFLKSNECETSITSFMCKNVLLSCILITQPEIWRPDNLLTIFMFCLRKLKQCILREYCPHFIIRENNLMAGKFSPAVKYLLLEKIQAVIDTQGYAFLSVGIDPVGHRLDIKMNTANDRTQNDLKAVVAGSLMYQLQTGISSLHMFICQGITSGKTTFYRIFSELVGGYYQQGNTFLRAACHLVTPLFCSSLGSLIASRDLQQHVAVSAEAFYWFLLGISSDVASTRLKLASVFYCIGDYERTSRVLKDIQDKYRTGLVEALCSCRLGSYLYSREFSHYADNNDTLSGKDISILCEIPTL